MSPTPTKTKRPTTHIGARAVSAETQDKLDEPLETVQRVLAIPLEKLHRHEANRVITPDSVAELVESMREHGQRDPLLVRPLEDPIGHFQILSGERRFVAAGQIPTMETLRCIVEKHSSPQSLIELAVANAARQDLNPIERAELLERLIATEENGGGGMERAAAGRLFGLNSESGVKNALRLLKLPRRIRELIAAGKVPIAKARPLCAYPEALLEAFADWLFHPKQKRELEGFASPSYDAWDETETINAYLRNNARPADNLGKFSLGYTLGGSRPPLFELTDDVKAKLNVVEIPNDPSNNGGEPAKAKTRLVALNCKEWDKLQLPFAKLAGDKKAGKAGPSAKVKGKPDAPKKPPTAAELKAKRKKADDGLAKFTRDWIREALRCAMSPHCQPELTLWLLGRLEAAGGYPKAEIGDLIEWALAELGKPQFALNAQEAAAAFAKREWEVTQTIWRVALWPVATKFESHADLTIPGELPDTLPPLQADDVDGLAEVLGVSAATFWKLAADPAAINGDPRRLVRAWCSRHTKEQLADLAKSLGVTIADGKRDDMVDELLAMHTSKKPLKLPAALTTVNKPKKGGRK